MRLTRPLGIAGALIVAALVGGTLINATLATDDATTATTTAYCEVFRDTFATELGVTAENLTAAGRAAALAAVEAAVAGGDLDEDRAVTMRARIEAYDGEGCGWIGHGGAFGQGFGLGIERGMARGLLGGDVLEAAADALEMERDELIAEVRDAGSLEALADAQGASYADVRAAVTAAVTAHLDAAVAEGLSRERADAVIDRLSAWLDDGGEIGEFGPGPGGHHGPLRGGWFGPWQDRDEVEEPGT